MLVELLLLFVSMLCIAALSISCYASGRFDGFDTVEKLKLHGRWEQSEDENYFSCSVCHSFYLDKDMVDCCSWDYCPNCGARMDGDE